MFCGCSCEPTGLATNFMSEETVVRRGDHEGLPDSMFKEADEDLEDLQKTNVAKSLLVGECVSPTPQTTARTTLSSELLNVDEELVCPENVIGQLSKSSSWRSTKDSMQIVDEFLSKGNRTASDVDAFVEKLICEVEILVDGKDDILLAEMLLRRSEQVLEKEQWCRVCESQVFDRYLRKLGYLERVGAAVTDTGRSWFNLFVDAAGVNRIDGCLDPLDSTVLHTRTQVIIPAKLTNCLAVANEIELLPTWNTLIVGEPKARGRRTAHNLTLNYQMSFLGGMYKVDVLNEIRRFTDVNGGFLAEFIETAAPDHPNYVSPSAGCKRPTTELKNVWLACGEGHSMLLQIGKVKLPFSATKWLATALGGLIGRFIVEGLVRNSLRSTEPGNQWEASLKEDKLGFYQRLDDCAASEASLARAPKLDMKLPAVEEKRLAELLLIERLREKAVRAVQ